MKKELIVRLHKSFEGRAHHQDSVEFWLARELQVLLGYNTWRRFEETIDRAKIACANAGQRVEDHFADAGKMVCRRLNAEEKKLPAQATSLETAGKKRP